MLQLKQLIKQRKREKFKEAIESIGLRVPKSIIVNEISKGLKDIDIANRFSSNP